MDGKSITRIVGEVYLAHGFDPRKVDDRSLKRWQKMVQALPDSKEFVEYCIEKLTDQESKPRNIGYALKNLWQEYKRENPQKLIRNLNLGWCQECGGHGFIIGYKWEDKDLYPVPARFVFACRFCDNYTRLWAMDRCPVKRVTRFELRNMGYEVPDFPMGETPVGKANVNQLVGTVGEHTNPGERETYFDQFAEDEVPF